MADQFSGSGQFQVSKAAHFVVEPLRHPIGKNGREESFVGAGSIVDQGLRLVDDFLHGVYFGLQHLAFRRSGIEVGKRMACLFGVFRLELLDELLTSQVLAGFGLVDVALFIRDDLSCGTQQARQVEQHGVVDFFLT